MFQNAPEVLHAEKLTEEMKQITKERKEEIARNHGYSSFSKYNPSALPDNHDEDFGV